MWPWTRLPPNGFWNLQGIPQVPYVAVVEGDDIDEKIAAIEANLSYPVFTKPSNMGSSVGISKSENQIELGLLSN